MRSSQRIAGTLLQYDEPEWKPLEALVGLELAAWFMWMCSVQLTDGDVAQAYKHVATRRYLHLTGDGRAFVYTPERDYREVTRRQAIILAFEGWESVTFDAGSFAGIWAALRRAIDATRVGFA
jgi:hypothetical protein